MSDSKYKEIAEQLNVDMETVQQWDKLSKKRDFPRRAYQLYVELAKKILAGIVLGISSITFLTVLAILSPLGTQILELLDNVGVNLDYPPFTMAALLLLAMSISGMGIVIGLFYLLDIDPGSL